MVKKKLTSFKQANELSSCLSHGQTFDEPELQAWMS